MPKKINYLFLIIFLGSLLFPLVSLATGIYQTQVNGDSVDICYEGLVPCGIGKPYWIEGTIENGKCQGTKVEGGITNKCQLCHLFVMINGIWNFVLFKIVLPVAVLMLVIGGIMFMVAHFGGEGMLPGGIQGGPVLLNQAKKLITSVVIGLVIILGAFLIVGMIFKATGAAEVDWTGFYDWAERGLFYINCPIEL